MNPYNQTSYNQQATPMEGAAAVGLMSASAYGGWKLAETTSSAIGGALGYGPKGPSNYQRAMNVARDASVVTGLLCSGLYLASVGAQAIADTWDWCFGSAGSASKKEPQTAPTAIPTNTHNKQRRDPSYLNSRRRS